MAEASYEEMILDILYVDGRISKAKLIGVLVGVVIFVANLIFLVPTSLRGGVLPFFVTVFICFLEIVIYYSICRGVGYLIRKFSN